MRICCGVSALVHDTPIPKLCFSRAFWVLSPCVGPSLPTVTLVRGLFRHPQNYKMYGLDVLSSMYAENSILSDLQRVRVPQYVASMNKLPITVILVRGFCPVISFRFETNCCVPCAVKFVTVPHQRRFITVIFATRSNFIR